MATIRTQILQIWWNRRTYSRKELGNYHYLISLSVLFTWAYHLWKFQRNLSGPVFEMKKYLVWQIFFIFHYPQIIRLSIWEQNFRALYRGPFENNNVFLLKKTSRPTLFFFPGSLKWHAQTLFAGAISTSETNAHAAIHVRILKIVNFYCFTFCKSCILHASTYALEPRLLLEKYIKSP